MVNFAAWVCSEDHLTGVPVALTDVGDVESPDAMATASDLEEWSVETSLTSPETVRYIPHLFAARRSWYAYTPSRAAIPQCIPSTDHTTPCHQVA